MSSHVFHRVPVLVVMAASLAVASAGSRRVPTIDDLLKVATIGGAQISPDGRYVAYTVTETDFQQDAYVTHVWLANLATGHTFQLTRGDTSAGSPQWSPDGQWLAFTSSRVGDKSQIFAIRPTGGEAQQLTRAETGVGRLAWSPDGTRIAFTATEPPPPSAKDRKEYLGDFEIVRQEYVFTHLWTFDVAEAMSAPVAGTLRTKGKAFSVTAFSWSPDGNAIAFSAPINPDPIQRATSDIYLLDLADNAVKKLVSQPGSDAGPRWSPDGKEIVFTSYMGNSKYFTGTLRLAVVPAAGGTPRSLTDGFDEIPALVAWNHDGIYFSGMQKTASHLFRIDPKTARITRISSPDALMSSSFSLTRDGRQVAYVSASPTSLYEVYVAGLPGFASRVLTTSSEQAQAFVLGTREVISWKSQDGTVIEGVLIKPADFDPAKKYPLLCIIHGGPVGVDEPVLLLPDARYYPADIWAGRGALILKVNYRGSLGYGEKFRLLNVRNLGVGDAWDVISGVDFLIGKGWVDPKKVACMGWSQGGYISAFLTTSSDRFAAISVGAGVSDWATYYYNTDLTPFTIDYLGDDPADDPAIYAKTSPMTYIKNARTPTLIQHGELDRRAPIPNAYELRQGLQDRGVKVEMVVYKGFGHTITRPKSMRAVMQHNLAWFNHYLWGDPLPDFTQPEVPKKGAK